MAADDGSLMDKLKGDIKESEFNPKRHITNPETPLPYKGMDIRTEIASRLYPAVFDQYIETLSNHPDKIASITLRFTDALIKQLNNKE